MSFKFKLDKDVPAGTVFFIPDSIKCEDCQKITPLQDFCMRCGVKLKLGYIGKFIERASDFEMKSGFQNIYREME